ncbi:hypothetical protein L6164_017854 [Bauhinia variegata]|uniref:Uncharacterized protein n=1 Tax=Bauhinia variegata TaxID=167791 RepID=A0ACB9NAK3_BAUVA|nr:hypothetical protein L6164_017854 [Bauhinia variegata]
MAILLDCKGILLAIFCFLFLLQWRPNQNSLFTNWPILGMLPSLLCNLSNIHDHITNALHKYGGTGEFIPPWFTQKSIVITSDPMNVHYITSKNFHKYPKGHQFQENFEILGQGIFTSDSEAWKNRKALLHSLFKQQIFCLFLEKIVREKVQGGLLPLLDHAERKSIEVDLQEVFDRFSFDNICSVVLGFDPHCLSIDFPQVVYEKGFNDSDAAIFHRYVLSRNFWKLQGWLDIGKENKMRKGLQIFDLFWYEFIRNKQLLKEARKYSSGVEEAELDLLTAFIKEKEKNSKVDDKFVRDNTLTMLAAGKSTITAGLTWFFWLVARHPQVEAKILEEIKDKFPAKEENKNKMVYGIEQVKKVIYLHAAICEALRLFPPVPFGQKQAINADTLPSGHRVKPDSMIIYSMYTMGRSKKIWGEDCLEFKPKRWISTTGDQIIHVPSYEFITFNGGPRSCLGKEMSFIEMKMVASTMLRNYHIQVVEGHYVSPALSTGLSMKQGLKVKITKRSTLEGKSSI